MTDQASGGKYPTAIQNNKILIDFDHLNYVKKYLSDSENYRDGIFIFQNRFDNLQYLVFAYMMDSLLLSLLINLRKLYNDTENCEY